MNAPSPHRLHRRPLILAALGGGTVMGGLAVASRSGILGEDDGVGPAGTLQLQETDDGLAALEIPLGDDVMPQAGPDRWRTAQLPTTVHSLVALTWDDTGSAHRPTVELSSRTGGTWGAWRRMRELHDVPDPDTGEGNGRIGTDLAWIGRADGVQVRVGGSRPEGLTLVLLHPAPDAAAFADLLARRQAPGRDLPPSTAPPPALLFRSDWDADPSWRDGSASYDSDLRQVHVHHTVDGSSYEAADVPGLLRAMYRYHTHNLGWSDIGYNFLVDRFGRAWVGRAGGPGRLVRGAHTLGFNDTSTGIAAIGNYEVSRPSAAMIATIAELAAWKLARFKRDPLGRTSVRSTGSDKFGSGRTVTLPVIDGHRDTNDTACPGRYLYEQLPAIRRRASTRLDQYAAKAVNTTAPFVLVGRPLLGRTLRVKPGRTDPSNVRVGYTWLRGDAVIRGAGGPTYRLTEADVGRRITAALMLRADGFRPAPRTLTTEDVVRSPGILDVTTRRGRRGKLLVTVRVRADGVAEPTGTVTITAAGATRDVPLAEGLASARFKAPGARRAPEVQVAYDGDRVTTPASVVVPVPSG